MVSYIVKENEKGQTLEKFVKRKLDGAPLSFIYKLFRKKDVKANGKWQTLKYVVKSGDEIKIFVTDQQLKEFAQPSFVCKAENVKDWIIYEDENILALNKPRGLLVQKNEKDGLALDVMVRSYYLKVHPELTSQDFLPSPAHRLDRNTSGVIIFGKSVEALQELMRIFKEHTEISKHYIALCKGYVKNDGEINAPLVKNQDTGRSFVSFKDNARKTAITKYKVIEHLGDLTLLDVELITGRTHQIRVHMAYINHPLVGDSKYGDFALNKEMETQFKIKDQFLHAKEIKFNVKEGLLTYLNSVKIQADLPLEDNDKLDKIRRELK